MRAVVATRPGDESVLEVVDLPSPRCGRSDVKINVAGAGLNRADLLQRRGLYPPPPGASEILGLECAGEIVEVGSGVSRFRVGDRVMALLTGGGYATEAVVHEACVMPVAAHLDLVEAAAVPEVFMTAFFNLLLLGGLERGETALIHGGSGGVGTAAIQLVRAVGAHPLVTAGSQDRCRRCRHLGAAAAFDYTADDWDDEVLDHTQGRGVNCILDCIGGAYLNRHLEILATGGRLMVIGLQGGRRAELDLGLMMRKRLTISGSTLRSIPTVQKGLIIATFEARFGQHLRDGVCGPIIDRTFSFPDAGEAHRVLAVGEVFGKVVLTP